MGKKEITTLTIPEENEGRVVRFRFKGGGGK